MRSRSRGSIPRGNLTRDGANERAIAAARDALEHLRAAKDAIDRSIRTADLAPAGADMTEEAAARLRDLDDGETSARGRISSARRKVATWIGLLEHGG